MSNFGRIVLVGVIVGASIPAAPAQTGQFRAADGLSGAGEMFYCAEARVGEGFQHLNVQHPPEPFVLIDLCFYAPQAHHYDVQGLACAFHHGMVPPVDC